MRLLESIVREEVEGEAEVRIQKELGHLLELDEGQRKVLLDFRKGHLGCTHTRLSAVLFISSYQAMAIRSKYPSSQSWPLETSSSFIFETNPQDSFLGGRFHPFV
jgi:hypothetical protein